MTKREEAIIAGIQKAEKEFGYNYKAALEDAFGELFDFFASHPGLARTYLNWKRSNIEKVENPRVRIM